VGLVVMVNNAGGAMVNRFCLHVGDPDRERKSDKDDAFHAQWLHLTGALSIGRRRSISGSNCEGGDGNERKIV
jgi:hypothetical protein